RGDLSTQTWTSLNAGSGLLVTPHSDPRALEFLDSQALLITNDGGMYGLANPLSPGTGGHWVSLNNSMEDTEFFSAAYDPTTGFISGGSQDNGSPVQNILGWHYLPSGGGDGGETAVDPNGVHYYFQDGLFVRDGSAVQMAGLTQQDRNNVNASLGQD